MTTLANHPGTDVGSRAGSGRGTTVHVVVSAIGLVVCTVVGVVGILYGAVAMGQELVATIGDLVGGLS